MRKIAAPVATVVTAHAKVGGDPQDLVDVARTRGDDMDNAVVAIQIDLHFTVRIQIVFPVFRGNVEFQDTAAPHAEIHPAVVVGHAVIPDLFHGRVFFRVDGPLAGDRVVSAGPGRGGRPDIVIFNCHTIHHIVDQAAVHLVPVIESPAAESCQSAAKQTDPEVPCFGMNIQCGHHAPGKAVLFLPAFYVSRGLVNTGQAVFGAHPDPGFLRLDGKDVVIGQTVLDCDMVPGCVDKRHLLRHVFRRIPLCEAY